MLVSYKWLNDYLDLSEISPNELADKMSVTGIEVEGIEVPAAGLKKIVVGEVKECVPHPDSDHLSICQVVDHSKPGRCLKYAGGRLRGRSHLSTNTKI